MTVTEAAIAAITQHLQRLGREERESVLSDRSRLKDCITDVLDRDCGAEVEGPLVRFDLGCAQAIVPYEELERAVLDALRDRNVGA